MVSRTRAKWERPGPRSGVPRLSRRESLAVARVGSRCVDSAALNSAAASPQPCRRMAICCTKLLATVALSAMEPISGQEEKAKMPIGAVPDRYRDILESTTLGHLATVDPNGRPQVNPVWFICEGQQILLSVKSEASKYRNMRDNPNVAISFLDLTRPDRYLEIRGSVIELELFDNLSWVNHLARKYTGADFAQGANGEHRYKVTIRVDSWTAQN